jgi:uncharacterized protein (TIGR03435 family)
MTSLVRLLSRQLDRTILDKTGLTGRYDIVLHWAPDEGSTPPLATGGRPCGSSASARIYWTINFHGTQEQLGLKLHRRKDQSKLLLLIV